MKRLRGSSRNLPVYICEYHDEALRCLHHAIRRRRLPFSELTMVHLDAHPDMSASATLPADTVFESPHDLYCALRKDAGGIAQWILPAVYGGHYKCVWWVRPSWALQIADGDYAVAVGRARRAPENSGGAAPRPMTLGLATSSIASSGAGGSTSRLPPLAEEGSASDLANLGGAVPETICISCPEPYFVEDGIYCPESALSGAKPLRLLVSQLPEAGGMPVGMETDQEPNGRAQGTNPFDDRFAAELVAGQAWTLDVCLDYFACGNPFLKQTRPCIAAPFMALQNEVSFRKQSVASVTEFLSARDAFDKVYNTMLKGALAADGEVDPDDVEALGAFLPEARRAPLLAELRSALEDARLSELQEVSEAFDMVCLPLHPVTEAEVQERMAAFDDFLQRLCAESKPAAVTIARSVVDGFCPMRWHCMLEQGVLEVLRRRLGDLDIIYSDELDAMENF